MPGKKSRIVWIIETDQKTFTATRYKDEPFYANYYKQKDIRLENLKPWIWGLNKQPCLDFRAYSNGIVYTTRYWLTT